MKKFYLTLLTFFSLYFAASAQKTFAPIQLRNGNFEGVKNLLNAKMTGKSLRELKFQNKYFAVLRFDQLPGPSEKKLLSELGVSLYDYLPANSFLAEITDSMAFPLLKYHRIKGVYKIPQQFKISGKLLQPSGSSPVNAGSVIAISFFGSTDKSTLTNEAQQLGAQIIPTKIQPSHVIFIRGTTAVLSKIASLPFVTYISEQSLKDIPLNDKNRAIHALDALGAFSGRNLQGKNVTVGVGDEGDPSAHIDFFGRLIHRNPEPPSFHGTHTAGTAGGGGNLNPRYKGMAPKATLLSQYFSDVMVNAPVYINDYNMVLTNNSYYSGLDGCPGEGEYDALSNYVDEQLNANSSLLHVFAAGNDGGLMCSPYPNFYGTVKSGFQTGKNVLTVGNISNVSYSIWQSSSRGPVGDGRIKPEIMGSGYNINSTIPFNAYAGSTGTSMACPTVTGTLALLYERYRQLHGGANPSAALIKAVACNSADDMGNPGPDYFYGFGMLNARTAVETIENNHYFTNTMNNAGSANFVISGLPAGVQQLKIMLYWSDPAASAFVASALVNNLDLTVTSPDATVHHPLVLDPTPSNVNKNAVEAVDNTNNIEQVVINNPPAGNFVITVNGTHIPIGPQDYVIAYEVINPSVNVEYPYGNETFVPGETENIRWSAYGGEPNGFTVEFSTDNGSTWNLLSNSVPSTSHLFQWTVAATPTNLGLVRVTRNSAGFSNTSTFPFTILGQPGITLTKPCPGYGQLFWNTIPSASQYEIMLLKADSMQSIASTTDTSYMIGGLNKDSSYWVSVRAISNTTAGRRSVAVNLIPNSGPCSLAAFNNDFTIDSLITPVTGRMFTSSQLGNTDIQVELKNLGSIASASPFNISFQVNGGAVVTESSPVSIPAGTAIIYTFSPGNKFDFSSPGNYVVKVWVDYPGDPQLSNDTLTTTIKQLRNDPITLNPIFTEGFESADPQSYVTRTIGFSGLDRCDFNSSDPNGRARTFVNTGFARTGMRCVTLDQSQNKPISSADSLITTFNLSGYTAADQIWLDFWYKNQGIDFSLPGNNVWIRGNDQAAWLLADSLSSRPADIGNYKASSSIDVTGILASALPSQTIGSSFQVKFGEQGYTSANSVIPDGNLDDGYSFDDIVITKSSNDLGLNALIQPVLSNICNLSSAEIISAQVKNYSNGTFTNVPISYSINGTTVTETIPSIGPNQTMIYNFSKTADLSAYQNYILGLWVSNPSDNYHKNDSLLNINFQTTPVISNYPYLEGFENNNGYWYTQGINDSWQWGTPAKTIINKAANGTKAWVTNLSGNYNDNELSYLYSPCFDLSSLVRPVLSFSHIFQTEDNCDCDYHWVEYSTDAVNWIKLGVKGNGTNWYDDSAKQSWQRSYTKWHVSSIDIPTRANKTRFRFVMSSDPATNYEGIGIDDIHIFDKAAIYNGSNIGGGFSQNLSGNNWINFDVDSNRVLAINPNGQELGNTQVKVYINKSGIRNANNQYYLDRNIVLLPSQAPTSNVSVRFYFLDSEADSLISATGCGSCTTISDAYEAGVSQYSKAPTEEDSTLRNNIHGTYQYILPRQQVKIIPYDNGYYAEYQVNGFSEFWINGGGTGKDQPLGVGLKTFIATKIDTTGLLQWSLSKEFTIDSFIIEKSLDSINFSPIGTVKAIVDTSSFSLYQFTDSLLLSGINYYRLRILNADGTYQYSGMVSINFSKNNFTIRIYPNPVTNGILFVNTSSNCNRIILYDVLGRLVKAENKSGLQNNISTTKLAKGVYIIRISTDTGDFIQKIVVE